MTVSVAQLCLTLCNPWTVAHQAPLFLEISRQEYGSWVAIPSLVARKVKNSPAMQEIWVWSLGWKDPLEKVKSAEQNILQFFKKDG